MSGCQRKFSMENCKKESAHKVAKTNATKTPLDTFKASLKDFTIQTKSLKQAAQDRTKWRCLINKGASKVPPNLKQRESVRLKGSVKKGKQEPRDHHQTQHSPNSLALLVTDSLELKLAYTAINESTNTHKRLIFRI